jgi:hypothetical protein
MSLDCKGISSKPAGQHKSSRQQKQQGAMMMFVDPGGIC